MKHPLLVLPLFTLAACGGGGSDGAGSAAPSEPLAENALQGLYSEGSLPTGYLAPLSVSEAGSTILTPDGRMATWIALNDGGFRISGLLSAQLDDDNEVFGLEAELVFYFDEEEDSSNAPGPHGRVKVNGLDYLATYDDEGVLVSKTLILDLDFEASPGQLSSRSPEFFNQFDGDYAVEATPELIEHYSGAPQLAILAGDWTSNGEDSVELRDINLTPNGQFTGTLEGPFASWCADPVEPSKAAPFTVSGNVRALTDRNGKSVSANALSLTGQGSCDSDPAVKVQYEGVGWAAPDWQLGTMAYPELSFRVSYTFIRGEESASYETRWTLNKQTVASIAVSDDSAYWFEGGQTTLSFAVSYSGESIGKGFTGSAYAQLSSNSSSEECEFSYPQQIISCPSTPGFCGTVEVDILKATAENCVIEVGIGALPQLIDNTHLGEGRPIENI